MSYKPSDTAYFAIRTRDKTTNALTDADSTPTLAVRHNGALDGSATTTITKRATTTGIYDCSLTFPGGYAGGDSVAGEATATVGGVTDSGTVFLTVLDGKRVSDLHDAAVLTDYQQRGVAVTLPANPPSGFLVTASYSTAPGWYTSPLTTLGANAPAGWINAAAIASAALNGKGDWNTTVPPSTGAIATAVLSDVSDTLGADIVAVKAVTDALAPMIVNHVFTLAAMANAGGGGVAVDGSGRVILAPDGLDAITADTGVNVRQAFAPILAAASGVILGAGTGTIIAKGSDGNTTRITATTDTQGNRTAVTLNLPA